MSGSPVYITNAASINMSMPVRIFISFSIELTIRPALGVNN